MTSISADSDYCLSFFDKTQVGETGNIVSWGDDRQG